MIDRDKSGTIEKSEMVLFMKKLLSDEQSVPLVAAIQEALPIASAKPNELSAKLLVEILDKGFKRNDYHLVLDHLPAEVTAESLDEWVKKFDRGTYDEE